MCLRNRVEAVLFAVGKKISVDDIASLCNATSNDVKKALIELETNYKERDCALLLSGGENIWKLSVREKYLDLVRNIIVETDLSRPCMETLALIAHKQPALQSEIIKQRSVGAYEHIKELTDEGFVVRQKKGRSFALKLTPRFFEYFDVDDDKIKEMFEKFKEEEEQIQESEAELSELETQRKKDEEETKVILETRHAEAESTYAEKMASIDDELEEAGIEGDYVEEVEEAETEIAREDKPKTSNKKNNTKKIDKNKSQT
jgi:segregation and condensation protein B